MATTGQRIADLERQLAELRGEFAATKFALEAAFDAGLATGRSEYPGTRSRARTASLALRGPHLRSVGGDAS